VPALAEDVHCEFLSGSDPDQVIAGCTRVLAAIADEATKEEAYYWRGYAHVEKHEFDAALYDYCHALTLNPNDARVYAESRYIYNEMRDFAKAADDLDAAVRLDAANIVTRNERAFSRHWLANFSGELEDRVAVARASPRTSYVLSLAWAHFWLGAIEDAKRDI